MEKATIRDTLFISHATPEDNEFTIWLATRLEQLGYKVWIDKNELLGGENFWGDIEQAIKYETVKFLLVYSNNIVYKQEEIEIKSGILKEINFAKQAAAENPALKDFFTILNIDRAPRGLFEGSADTNQISFDENWAAGLGILVKKLEKDQIVKAYEGEKSAIAKFYLSQYLSGNKVVKKKELYYTNWWNTEKLPKHFYIFRFVNEVQAIAVSKANNLKISFRAANCIVCFSEILDQIVDSTAGKVEIENVERLDVEIGKLIAGYDSDTFPSYLDASNYFKRLLKRALHVSLREKGLSWYELSNKNNIYFHTIESLPKGKVTFDFAKQDRKKTKNLFGKHLEIGNWHFALSFRSVLHPEPGFHINSHILFTSNGKIPIESKSVQHSHRRRKGRRMFNEEWRDQMLAFLASLKRYEDPCVSMRTDCTSAIEMKAFPEIFWSQYGYMDPKEKERMEIFIDETDLYDLDDEEF
ncbi:TIR domain-containing protein [Pedobacter sp. LMG 31464]|uniref:TIR domain-containing protein n=1 Tax=Pedobacter planticolens TaxID=2679964 RepID=A0A923IUC4_9SPHI|nr:toll/interleukin-1 receptor domain-containing protein [Pedobacter planticolens]MBB2144628.1 TIR domain-containing protein [Pedobacter planticolens]